MIGVIHIVTIQNLSGLYVVVKYNSHNINVFVFQYLILATEEIF